MTSLEKKTAATALTYTGERYLPEVGGDIALEHIHRYLIARDAVKNLCVLDIACGEGYGSAMLAETALQVFGVDISAMAIDHAQSVYKMANLAFMVGAADRIPLPDDSVDAVVSFETIEHHDKHNEMLAEIKRVLRPGGTLIVSSPDKKEFSEIPGHSNPFHVKELYAQEFRDLISSHFTTVRFYGQRIIYGSIVASEDTATRFHGYRLGNERLESSSGIHRPLYLIAFASDGDVLVPASGILEQPINESGVVTFWSATVKALEDRIHTMEASEAELKESIHALNASEAELRAQLNDAIRQCQEELALRACKDEECARLAYRLNALQSGPAWRLAQPIRALESSWRIGAKVLAAVPRLIRDLMTGRLVQRLRIRRNARRIVRSGLFDEQWYVPRNVDVVLAGRRPLDHWMSMGWREGRDPAQGFNTQRYIAEHPALLAGDTDPLTHYLCSQRQANAAARSPVLRGRQVERPKLIQSGALDLPHRIWRALPISIENKVRIKRKISRFIDRIRGVDASSRTGYVSSRTNLNQTFADQSVPLTTLPPPVASTLPVRLIAFYLPQYHPIPENDAWWGRGFTEWRNVVRGQPRFEGHYQPHLPGELGFYDLRVLDVQRRQVELAKLYGVGGFCFYFYWFAGKRLLELPVRQYLENADLDLPFCLCWANENWSRRWDGRDRDILISQEHSAEDDLAFIEYISAYLRDPRYIRVDGKPLLLVYRPSLLLSATETAERWRTWCRNNGVGEIYLAYTQSFERVNPLDYGFDAAIEFPPNYVLPADITGQVEELDPGFRGSILDWNGFLEASRKYSRPDYTLYRTVCPSWDNEARRPNAGSVFHGASPEGYAEWLGNATRDTLARFADPSSRLVFVNAWNEWAEGAHLEPDQRYGYAYLQATRDALTGAVGAGDRKIVVVTHDAHLNGAQYLALNLARELKNRLDCSVHIVVLGSGPLLTEYARVGTVTSLDGLPQDGSTARDVAARLAASGYKDAIVNSAASGLFVTALAASGIRVISLVHELPDLIRRHRLEPHVLAIAADARHVVFAARAILRGFELFCPLESGKSVIRPQGLYKRNAIRRPEDQRHARTVLRSRFGLPETAELVIGVGYGDYRKGIDLFVDAAIAVMRRRPHCAFIWVGNIDDTVERAMVARTADAEHLSRLFFPGHESDTDLFYAGADLYAMTSREDPFPSVVLESLDVGIPVVGFDGAGGFTELAVHGCVRLVPAFDTSAFAKEIDSLLSDGLQRQAAGAAGRALMAAEFGFCRYAIDLLALTPIPYPRVSVVVPNFNYLRYLPERIRSIAAQTHAIYELIVLDDASTDGSREWLSSQLPAVFDSATVVLNETNSGSVFVQWLAGVRRARGDFVWIAEADDLSDPEFLTEVLRGFEDPDVVMSYSQSKQIDGDGQVLCDHYLDYVADISPEHWLPPYVESGVDEIRLRLAVKNTIPNVSAVVFRRTSFVRSLEERFDEIRQYRNAGDWLAYTEVLKHGKIAFTPRSLNLHRRHASGVTLSGLDERQFNEIVKLQRYIRDRFDVPDEVTAKADAYAESLRLRLGLERSAQV